MNNWIKKGLHIVGISILCFSFCLGFYYLVINAFHSNSISKKIYVSENDNHYKSYVKNLKVIKENLDNYSYKKSIHKYDNNTMSKIYSKLNSCYNMLNSSNSIINYKEESLLGYYDVYDLNNYFINSLVDKCYTSNLLWISNDKNYNLGKRVFDYKKTVDILAYNSKYIRDELKDNSSYYYNTKNFNINVRNNLDSSYQFILHNYDDFSNIILELSNYLIRGE